jgi:hypothetical protein
MNYLFVFDVDDDDAEEEEEEEEDDDVDNDDDDDNEDDGDDDDDVDVEDTYNKYGNDHYYNEYIPPPCVQATSPFFGFAETIRYGVC